MMSTRKRLLISVFGCTLLAAVSLGAIHANKVEKRNPLAVVINFKPSVEVLNGVEVIRLTPEDKAKQLFDGDTLETKKDGFALVSFMDKSRAKVKPNSLLIVRGDRQLTRKVFTSRIDLTKGELFLNVAPQGALNFEVATDKSVASVKGTAFGTRSDGYYWVEEGEVEVTALNSGQIETVLAREYVKVDADGNVIEKGTLTQQQVDDLSGQFKVIDAEFTEKEMTFTFRDANGQIRTQTVKYFEKQN